MNATVNIYTFSFKNPVRAERMKRQFAQEDIPLTFVEPVPSTDPRVVPAPDNVKRLWAIMFSHLDMLKTFLESDAHYGIFCEDDVCIRKGLKHIIPEVAANFKKFNFDVLLLSYLTMYKPVTYTFHPQHFEYDIPFAYLTYYPDIWGAHMYMLSRESAQRHLESFTPEYAIRTLTDQSLSHFSPDWTLTKHGRRALIYPMLGVEAGEVATDHQGQAQFHKQCFDTHFHPDKFYV